MRRIDQKTDVIIEKQFNTKWHKEDFLEGYRAAKGIENRELTEEELADFERQMSDGRLKGFKETIIQEVNERMLYLFD